MKKLILIAALVFGGSIVANAQAVSLKTSDQMKQETQAKQKEEIARKLEIQNDAASKKAMSAEQKVQVAQKGSRSYNEVSISEVPQAVQDALAKQNPGASISKAAVDSRGIYKLQISDASQDSGTRTIYINKSGISDAPSSLKN